MARPRVSPRKLVVCSVRSSNWEVEVVSEVDLVPQIQRRGMGQSMVLLVLEVPLSSSILLRKISTKLKLLTTLKWWKKEISLIEKAQNTRFRRLITFVIQMLKLKCLRIAPEDHLRLRESKHRFLMIRVAWWWKELYLMDKKGPINHLMWGTPYLVAMIHQGTTWWIRMKRLMLTRI